MMRKTEKTPAGLFATRALASQVKNELVSNILPYWRQKVCRPEGGFWKCPYHNGRMCMEIIERA